MSPDPKWGVHRGRGGEACRRLVTVLIEGSPPTRTRGGMAILVVSDGAERTLRLIWGLTPHFTSKKQGSAWTLPARGPLVAVATHGTTPMRSDIHGQRSGKAQRQKEAQAREVGRAEISLCPEHGRQEVTKLIVPGTQSGTRYDLIHELVRCTDRLTARRRRRG